MASVRRKHQYRGMSMRRSAAAVIHAARSVEIGRLVHHQTEQAIFHSLKLLRLPVYPDDQARRPEQ